MSPGAFVAAPRRLVAVLQDWVLHFKEHPFFGRVFGRVSRRITPNHISIGRLAFLVPAWWFMGRAFNLPSLACVTACFVGDFADGALSKHRLKKYGEKSPHGAFVDQACDKLASIGLLLYLRPRLPRGFDLPIFVSIAIAASLLLLRTNAYVRAWIRAGEPPEESQAAGASGKWKTMFEMFSIGSMILGLGIASGSWIAVAFILLVAADVAAVFSLIRRWKKT